VSEIEPASGGFAVTAGGNRIAARRVVLSTGGQSLPKTGSDGLGYVLAQRLGHTLIPLTPALDPLVLQSDYHAALAGNTQAVEFTVQTGETKPARVRGILLWTHFGVSGPGVLDVSRHWHRARVEGREVSMRISFLPGDDAPRAEARLIALATELPKVHLHNALARLLPARVADMLLVELGVPAETPMAHLGKEARRRVAQALVAWPLPVVAGRGYAFAEATAGGVPLSEVDPRTLQSRKCPGLYFTGEILDVDGRIGGFNFQWAWSSAWVAATALAQSCNQGDGFQHEDSKSKIRRGGTRRHEEDY
jgi:predicted Rossmann fold flavoprotein